MLLVSVIMMREISQNNSSNDTFFSQDAERMRLAMNAAGIGVWEVDLIHNKLIWDQRCRELFGTMDEGINYEEALGSIHPDDVSMVDQKVQAALRGDNGGIYNATYRTIGHDDGRLRWVNFSGSAYFDEGGKVLRFAGIAQDVTDTVLVREASREKDSALRSLQKDQDRLVSLFEQSFVAIAIVAKENLTFKMANSFYGVLVDRKPEEIIGKPLLDALPEIAGQGFDDLLNGVIESGKPFIARAVPANIKRGESVQQVFVDLAYQPIKEEDNTVSGVFVIATDVTQAVLSTKDIQDSESKFRSLVENAPAAICLFTSKGRNTIEIANDAMLKVWGKNASAIGKPLLDAVPELRGQPFSAMLDSIYDSGVAITGTGTPAQLKVDGVLTTRYFDFTYQPLFDAKGKVYGILDIALDVTRQVLARKAVDESEASLADAVNLAELGTWMVDFITGKVTHSDRLQDWLGVQQSTLNSEASPRVHSDDRERIGLAMKTAALYSGSGKFDEVYKITNDKTGQIRTIHANGRTTFGENGEALSMTGTAQDVTQQQALRFTLEEAVKAKTAELAQGVKDLAEANDKLEASNKELLRSNEELAQYAYVASHDLQEPLRKIQLFADQLGNREQSPAQQVALTGKIQNSTKRMSLLIGDLLEFSRLLKSDALFRPLDLKAVVKDVLGEFELLIAEKAAEISIRDLPVVDGVALQLNQLFTNLIGNALKFTSPNRKPIISIQSRVATAAEVATYIENPLAGIVYFHITVADNGIGFDTVYLNQIFEVFKRLHGRHEYGGSGIGLAICRRVVQNHKGQLFADAVPDEGARFHILLPQTQSNGETAQVEETL